MNPAVLPLPDRRPGRRMLLLLVAALALPFVLAAALFFAGWRPPVAMPYGELLPLQPPLALDALQVRSGPEKSALAGRWLLVAVEAGACNAACAQRLDVLRRMHVALYKSMPRLKRVLLADAAPVAAVVQPDLTVGTGWPALAPAHVYVVDPQGRAVLRYAADDLPPTAMLKDIERLLRYSWSG